MTDLSRVTRTHVQTRANYDRLSRWYDAIEGGWETAARIYARQALVEAGFILLNYQLVSLTGLGFEVVIGGV